MHWIQKHIVDLLMNNQSLRFSELRAAGVDSNLFQYHLKKTVSSGLVQKSGTVYQLAPEGLFYADRYSPELKDQRPQPKLITIIITRDNEDRLLLQRKLRQPWINTFQMPAGKIHIGESTEEAARRELEEKTGIKSKEPFTLKFSIYVRIVQNNVTISDYFALVYSTHTTEQPRDGVWVDTENDLDNIELAPSISQIIQFEKNPSGGVESLLINIE